MARYRGKESALKILAIAVNTAREAIRNKILYSILFFSFVVVGIAAVFGAASIGDQIKFIKDFSLMSISLFGIIIAIVIGVSLLSKELGRKTIFNILAKPVTRWEFIVGKYLGLVGTLTIVVALMCACLILFLSFLEGRPDWGLVLASGVAVLELMIVIAFAMLFSSILVTPTLAGFLTAAIFIVGRCAGYLRYFNTENFPDSLRTAVNVLYVALPRLHHFNIADLVVYDQLLTPSYLAQLLVYALAYSTTLLVLSITFFSRREFF